MGEALIRGVVSERFLAPSRILVSDINKNRLNSLKKKCKIKTTSKNQDAVDFADVIILAVKPQDMGKLFKQIRVPNKKVVISIAAGISLKYLQKKMPKAYVVRTMPNNPALVGKGITAIALSKGIPSNYKNLVAKIFNCIGQIVFLPEKYMDAVTAISGSGPAFVYLSMEAMLEAAKRFKIPAKEAQRLVLNTFLGASETCLKTDIPPGKLREMVTSKGGTTIAGLKVLKKKKFKKALIEALKRTAKRSSELNLSRNMD